MTISSRLNKENKNKLAAIRGRNNRSKEIKSKEELIKNRQNKPNEFHLYLFILIII